MLFIDYVFEVGPTGSLTFDRELSIDKLNWQEGDEFRVRLFNNRVLLEKITSADSTTDQPIVTNYPVY